MHDPDTRRYLIVIRLGNTAVDRLRIFVPSLQKVLERVAAGPVEQLFRSVTADIFGYLLRSKLVAPQIAAAIESPNRSGQELNQPGTIDPFMTNADSVAVIEIGEDYLAGVGFTRAGAWLRHH